MSHDADDKAKIKEKLIPYVIGAVLLFGGSGLLGLVSNFARNMDKEAPAHNPFESITYVTCPICKNQVPDTGRCNICFYTFK